MIANLWRFHEGLHLLPSRSSSEEGNPSAYDAGAGSRPKAVREWVARGEWG